MAITLSDSMRSTAVSVDAYGSTKISAKTNVIDLKAMYGLCPLRDQWSTDGTGAVTNSDATYTLSISGEADRAVLSSRERGCYVAGFVSEAGIGLIMGSTVLSGSQTLEYGYFDDDNGYFFRLSAGNVLSLHMRKKGVTIDMPQDIWNGDHAQHSTIDFTRGIVFHIEFTFYGVGAVLYSIINCSPSGAQMNRLLHSSGPAAGLSCCCPNLPITVRLDAGGTATPASIDIGGRQFAIHGTYAPKFRCTPAECSLSSIGSETETHMFSFRKEAAYVMCAVKVASMDVIATAPVVISVYIDAALDGALFTAPMEPVGCEACATVLEKDTVASTSGGGLLVYKKIVGAGYTFVEVPTCVSLDDRPITFTVRALTSTADMTVCVRMREYY